MAKEWIEFEVTKPGIFTVNYRTFRGPRHNQPGMTLSYPESCTKSEWAELVNMGVLKILPRIDKYNRRLWWCTKCGKRHREGSKNFAKCNAHYHQWDITTLPMGGRKFKVEREDWEPPRPRDDMELIRQELVRPTW